MDTKYLSYILAIARRENMTKAVEELYVSRSSLSQYLSRLEQEIGDPLFIRAKGELLLAPTGELYVEAVRKVIRIRKDLYQDIRSLNNKGHITIGVMSQFDPRMLTEIVPAYKKEFPQVTIEILEPNVPALIRMLLDEGIDCATMALNSTDAFSREQVSVPREEEVLFVVPTSHECRKCNQDSAMTQKELVGEFGKDNFMPSKKGSILRVPAGRIFTACNSQPSTMCETDNIIATRAMMAKGTGVTFTASFCVNDRENVAYYSLDPKLYRYNVLVLRKNLIQNRLERVLLQYIYDYFRGQEPEAPGRRIPRLMLRHGDFCDIIIRERDKRNRGINSYLLFCTEWGYIHMRQKLSKYNLPPVGFILFSMFFGAGNLIFLPFLGAQAGSLTWQVMRGFLISVAGLPAMGVVAATLSGGLINLARGVYPWLAFLSTLLIYPSIGPYLTIPRTVSTSFEMTVPPALTGMNLNMQDVMSQTGSTLQTLSQSAYSALFFIVAMIVTFRPEEPTDRLGKVLCPTLSVLIGVIPIGYLARPMGPYGTPSQSFSSGPVIKGFLEGYQTMDTIVALNLGTVIALNIRVKGVEQEGAIVQETIKAGVIAGILLAPIYGALAHIGAPAGTVTADTGNGARILTYVAGSLFGQAGMMILGIIFFIARFNTCVGLLSCYSQYFITIIPLIRYKMWVAVFAVISLVISNAGLNQILVVSVPVLSAIYPMAIVLIALVFMGPLIKGWPAMFPCSILFTGIVSVIYALEQSKVVIPLLSQATTLLPGYGAGLGWTVLTLAGMAVGVAVSPVMESGW